ncbi:S8 family peptidase [Polycladomyces subterraneus]|uniref:S8 family peptidase n=1 Tax=Polycladomyces subterraneus TaxID=1016997 RepID=A0ABT8IJA5_9BACL|nr:S8 family peptidase [Polycladomyces subterraneus]MDN4592860.1 S8 family peptidase [Polycladomyces subterraneus]
MKRSFALLTAFILLMVMALPIAPHAQAAPADTAPYAPGEIIVKFKPGIVQSQITSLHRTNQAKLLFRSKEIGFDVIRASGKSVTELIRDYRNNPLVEYAEPNYYFHATWTPNDPALSKQWALPKIRANDAWNATKSNNGIRVAVVDTGVQYNHPDLYGKVIKGYDYVGKDWDPSDGNGHGTHVAGVIAAATNNHKGIAGIAPNAMIYAVRVLDNNGNGTLENVANGIIHAADQGAKVINLSLGAGYDSQTLKDAVQYAWSKGAVVVAAAGNSNSSQPSYPAYYDQVIAVGATDKYDNKASFSNFGSWVDVAAPGVDIYSTYPIAYGQYATMSGTSMAAPHVSGLAALLAAQGRSNSEIRDAIQKTADKTVGTGTYWTYGRINASKAVRY